MSQGLRGRKKEFENDNFITFVSVHRVKKKKTVLILGGGGKCNFLNRRGDLGYWAPLIHLEEIGLLSVTVRYCAWCDRSYFSLRKRVDFTFFFLIDIIKIEYIEIK